MAADKIQKDVIDRIFVPIGYNDVFDADSGIFTDSEAKAIGKWEASHNNISGIIPDGEITVYEAAELAFELTQKKNPLLSGILKKIEDFYQERAASSLADIPQFDYLCQGNHCISIDWQVNGVAIRHEIGGSIVVSWDSGNTLLTSIAPVAGLPVYEANSLRDYISLYYEGDWKAFVEYWGNNINDDSDLIKNIDYSYAGDEAAFIEKVLEIRSGYSQETAFCARNILYQLIERHLEEPDGIKRLADICRSFTNKAHAALLYSYLYEYHPEESAELLSNIDQFSPVLGDEILSLVKEIEIVDFEWRFLGSDGMKYSMTAPLKKVGTAGPDKNESARTLSKDNLYTLSYGNMSDEIFKKCKELYPKESGWNKSEGTDADKETEELLDKVFKGDLSTWNDADLAKQISKRLIDNGWGLDLRQDYDFRIPPPANPVIFLETALAYLASKNDGNTEIRDAVLSVVTSDSRIKKIKESADYLAKDKYEPRARTGKFLNSVIEGMAAGTPCAETIRQIDEFSLALQKDDYQQAQVMSQLLSGTKKAAIYNAIMEGKDAGIKFDDWMKIENIKAVEQTSARSETPPEPPILIAIHYRSTFFDSENDGLLPIPVDMNNRHRVSNPAFSELFRVNKNETKYRYIYLPSYIDRQMLYTVEATSERKQSEDFSVEVKSRPVDDSGEEVKLIAKKGTVRELATDFTRYYEDGTKSVTSFGGGQKFSDHMYLEKFGPTHELLEYNEGNIDGDINGVSFSLRFGNILTLKDDLALINFETSEGLERKYDFYIPEAISTVFPGVQPPTVPDNGEELQGLGGSSFSNFWQEVQKKFAEYD